MLNLSQLHPELDKEYKYGRYKRSSNCDNNSSTRLPLLMSAFLSLSVIKLRTGKDRWGWIVFHAFHYSTLSPNKESNHMHGCKYEEHCGSSDGTGYTYLCDIHRHEDDRLQAAEEARRHDAHIELLRRVDDPNDYFDEDDLERRTTP